MAALAEIGSHEVLEFEIASEVPAAPLGPDLQAQGTAVVSFVGRARKAGSFQAAGVGASDVRGACRVATRFSAASTVVDALVGGAVRAAAYAAMGFATDNLQGRAFGLARFQAAAVASGTLYGRALALGALHSVGVTYTNFPAMGAVYADSANFRADGAADVQFLGSARAATLLQSNGAGVAGFVGRLYVKGAMAIPANAQVSLHGTSFVFGALQSSGQAALDFSARTHAVSGYAIAGAGAAKANGYFTLEIGFAMGGKSVAQFLAPYEFGGTFIASPSRTTLRPLEDRSARWQP